MRPKALGDPGGWSEFWTNVDVFNLSNVAMVVVEKSGNVRRVNAAFGHLVGRIPEELLGAPVSWVGTSGDLRRLRKLHQQIVDNELDGPVVTEVRFVRPDGDVVWVDLTIFPICDEHGMVTGFLDQAVEITERKAAEEAAAREFDMLEQAQRVAQLGSFEFDPRKNEFDASTELRRLLGFNDSHPTTISSLIEVIHPDDRARLGAVIEENLKSHTPVDAEHRLLLADGTLRWVHARVEWVEAGPDVAGHVLGTVLDITDRKLAEDALAFAGAHDDLTGLLNRTSFLEHVESALRVAQRQPRQIAVLLLDIDDFKHVNDGLGHTIGDQLLVALSRRVVTSARGRDLVARLGGDEFGLLIESGHAAEEVARRIIDALRAPFALEEHHVQVSASIGIAFSSPDSDAGVLLRDADLAMYLAKKNGKGRFEVAHAGMHDKSLERLITIEELQHGVEHHEFEVYYQAIVHTETSALAGAEALVRWNNPRIGLVLPGLFIALAEESGLIIPIGHEVRREACRQLATWRKIGIVDDSFYVSVNLSARQLGEETLVENVARDLADSGLPAQALVLEITESAVMADSRAGLARLLELKAIGLRLALDDYGTGFSSLSRLADMPIDIIKIDKSFIDRLISSDDGPMLVKSVVDAAVALHVITIAEGVEDEDQRRMLVELGCNNIQGYLFAKPVPAAQAEHVISQLRSSNRTASGTSTGRRNGQISSSLTTSHLMDDLAPEVEAKSSVRTHVDALKSELLPIFTGREADGSRHGPVGRRVLLAGAAAASVEFFGGWGSDSLNRNINDAGYYVAILGAVMAIVWRIRRSSGRSRASWLLFGAALVSWGIGEMIWDYYVHIINHELPFPSFADVGYLGFPLLACAGLLVRPTPSLGAAGRTQGLINGFLVTGSLFLVTWVTALGAVAAGESTNHFQFYVGMAYPITDLILLSVAIYLLGRSREWTGLFALTLGITAFSVADSWFSYATATGTYVWGRSPYDVGWLLGFVLIGEAALRDRPDASHSHFLALRAQTKLALSLPYLLVAVALLVALWSRLTSNLSFEVTWFVPALLLIVLLLRQFAMVIENRSLVERVIDQEFQLRRQVDVLAAQTRRDPLTGLANRIAFYEQLNRAMARHGRGGHPIAILMCDLDGFKSVNDTFGHVAGDALLVWVADVFRRASRSSDTVARLGGDEFAVIVEDGGDPSALSKRIRSLLVQGTEIEGRLMAIEVSIGVGLLQAGETVAPEELVNRADQGMYEDKRRPKEPSPSGHH